MVLMQLTSTTATIRYGTGAVLLRLIYDTVTMAGITLPRQGVGVATALTSDFNYVSCDGLVVSFFTIVLANYAWLVQTSALSHCLAGYYIAL